MAFWRFHTGRAQWWMIVRMMGAIGAVIVLAIDGIEIQFLTTWANVMAVVVLVGRSILPHKIVGEMRVEESMLRLATAFNIFIMIAFWGLTVMDPESVWSGSLIVWKNLLQHLLCPVLVVAEFGIYVWHKTAETGSVFADSVTLVILVIGYLVVVMLWYMYHSHGFPYQFLTTSTTPLLFFYSLLLLLVLWALVLTLHYIEAYVLSAKQHATPPPPEPITQEQLQFQLYDEHL
ncbi:sac3 ganp domain protein [Pelomyxa schiedti]|nr:sac3 ganp domain protein [Pelomyxa schiedti]